MIKKNFVISLFIFSHTFSFAVQQPGINDVYSEFAPIDAFIALPVQPEGMPIELQMAFGVVGVVGVVAGSLCLFSDKPVSDDIYEYFLDSKRAENLDILKKFIGDKQEEEPGAFSQSNSMPHEMIVVKDYDRQTIASLLKALKVK